MCRTRRFYATIMIERDGGLMCLGELESWLGREYRCIVVVGVFYEYFCFMNLCLYERFVLELDRFVLMSLICFKLLMNKKAYNYIEEYEYEIVYYLTYVFNY